MLEPPPPYILGSPWALKYRRLWPCYEFTDLMEFITLVIQTDFEQFSLSAKSTQMKVAQIKMPRIKVTQIKTEQMKAEQIKTPKIKIIQIRNGKKCHSEISRSKCAVMNFLTISYLYYFY